MSDGQPVTAYRIATICNQRGLHARAAARFVKTAGQFDADVRVKKNGTEVSGRSIMGLMMLAAAAGTAIELTATGREAEAAIAAARSAMEGNDPAALKQATERLSQSAMKLGEAMYKAQQADQAAAADSSPHAAGDGAHPGGPGGGGSDDKVVDAEFEEVDEKKKKSA
jgi:phosphotransferase system HPr (HPr) family protein